MSERKVAIFQPLNSKLTVIDRCLHSILVNRETPPTFLNTETNNYTFQIRELVKILVIQISSQTFPAFQRESKISSVRHEYPIRRYALGTKGMETKITLFFSGRQMS